MADNIDPSRCGAGSIGMIGLRVGALFAILITSMIGTAIPLLFKRISVGGRYVPTSVFEFVKYFGSGVILATALIHLLPPATDALGAINTYSHGGCISDDWADYPYAFGICLAALFTAFVFQVAAFRMVEDMREKKANPGGLESTVVEEVVDEKAWSMDKDDGLSKVLSVAMLEFGIDFHSVIIGLTLAVHPDPHFVVLFVVIIFHQSCEGLGLGARITFMNLSPKYSYVPWVAALVYCCATPLGMAIGLAARSTLAMGGNVASITVGVVDAVSSGIMIYTSTVELIAHDFIFSPTYKRCSWTKLWFSLFCFGLGAGAMSVIGKWA